MIRRLTCASALLAALAPALAQDDVRCNPSGAQAGLNACAADDFKKADKELNATWQALLRKEAADKIFAAKLRTAQKAWLAFRDAELDAHFACESEDSRMCWGSMEAMSYLMRKKDLTQQRTRMLKDMLERGHGHYQ
ncbi:lysozyme inhibitor LprI family protein [Pseudoduganella chitinolytica]|uniref:Lysozyme inhibitor LprI family protein n=1 Tax=Pseudoduganella chitinolytica TaxID=34070 RepID=A0ABY8BFM6_9BURK|nr:lysozyme inhibitor LprI family protein [Pseudoduganella chitinolytica]WEF33532.1 lysozyme inhibitor LprI family protein [Pseudoduganella chitinolytica]